MRAHDQKLAQKAGIAVFRLGNCKRFALPASAQPSLREGSGTPKSSVGKVRILLKACDRTSSPVLVRCSEAVLLGRFEIRNWAGLLDGQGLFHTHLGLRLGGELLAGHM